MDQFSLPLFEKEGVRGDFINHMKSPLRFSNPPFTKGGNNDEFSLTI
jgi:hypothetical protein